MWCVWGQRRQNILLRPDDYITRYVSSSLGQRPTWLQLHCASWMPMTENNCSAQCRPRTHFTCPWFGCVFISIYHLLNQIFFPLCQLWVFVRLIHCLPSSPSLEELIYPPTVSKNPRKSPYVSFTLQSVLNASDCGVYWLFKSTSGWNRCASSEKEQRASCIKQPIISFFTLACCSGLCTGIMAI